ncbi:hypothetical protein PUN28_001830 [Cardiocondyla obscurior]|uniref:Uncharacterized protein n=1 Tax=Cardiocondyla obscurior TaxID=286306 RepID=A0AAW2GRC9_9HYME
MICVLPITYGTFKNWVFFAINSTTTTFIERKQRSIRDNSNDTRLQLDILIYEFLSRVAFIK